MNHQFIDKTAIILSWPREIDMYSKFLDLDDNLSFDFIVNDIKSIEKGRNQSKKLNTNFLQKYIRRLFIKKLLALEKHVQCT
jgi:hypothetical protein